MEYPNMHAQATEFLKILKRKICLHFTGHCLISFDKS